MDLPHLEDPSIAWTANFTEKGPRFEFPVNLPKKPRENEVKPWIHAGK